MTEMSDLYYLQKPRMCVDPLLLFQVCIKYNNNIKSNITLVWNTRSHQAIEVKRYCLNLNLSFDLFYCTEWSICYR